MERLADKAYSTVEELIVTLALPPGHIFSEKELSLQIDIGRTPLREALQRLASDRLVKVLPRKGMMVSDINIADHLAMLETRRVLDRLVAARAARRASADQFLQLEVIRKKMQHAADTDNISAFMRQDREFDEVLEAAARNPFASQALAPLHTHCRRFWYRFQHEGDLLQSATLHRALIDAVLSKNESAAEQAADGIIDYLDQFTREALRLI